MAVERHGSKTDIVIKLVLVFFISLLSFSIGTFVGKKFSDNQHKISQVEPTGEQNGLQGDDSHREVASVHPTANEVKPSEALTDNEIKKLAEEFVADEKAIPPEPLHKTDKNSEHQGTAKIETHGETTNKHNPTKAPTVGTFEQPAKTGKGLSPVAQRLLAKMSPEEEISDSQIKDRIPQSLPKEIAASAAGKYTVQVGSYPDESEAQKISSGLKEKSFSAFYIKANVKGKIYYRVCVGLFTTQKKADAYKKDLLDRAKVASAFVQKVTN